MKKICLKEYDYLKSEITEIKSWINKYIGYVIGVSGITTILAKYLITPENSEQLSSHSSEVEFTPFASILVLVAMIIITFLFDILWYKFKSHNKLAGYMQLLSQEIGLYELTNDIKFDKKKIYLKKETPSIPSKCEEDLITWEFVMSRLNDISKNETKERILKSTKHSYYTFKLANNYSPEKLGNDFIQLDKLFYRNCIIPQFSNNKMISIRQIVINFFSIFTGYKMRKFSCNIDEKYFPVGWSYPLKLIQLGILSIIGLSLSFFYCMSFFYEFEIKSFIIEFNLEYYNNILSKYYNLGTLLFIIWLLIVIKWLCVFIGKANELMNGKYSIEYYCWQFLIFRTQYLNSKGILPKYYSRNFIRFYKSYSILKYLETRKNNKEVKIDNYKTALKNCSKFSKIDKETHKKIINKAKEYCSYSLDDYDKSRKTANS